MRKRIFAITLVAGLLPLLPAPGRAAAPSARVEPGLLDVRLTAGVIARFEDAIPRDLGRIPGLQVQYRFTSIPAVLANATPSAIRTLAAREDLAYLEQDKPVEFDLDTATLATGARDVYEPDTNPDTPPLLDATGNTIDGRGVGIAIVDAGLDGLHPDFAQPGKVQGNYIVTPRGLVAAPWTAHSSAHGTHVAGIAAGNGFASGGVFKGAAPGAAVYAFAIFGANGISHASMAFDWILTNGKHQNPPIRVVNNSWHCSPASCNAFNPYGVHMYLASQLAGSGITVTWSAGNDGGDGFTAQTNPEAQNPTPGIIGVANSTDNDRGDRTGCVVSSSSRGLGADASTWPDLAAPGQLIMSSYALRPEQNTRAPDGRNTYRTMSGTSMAAPHVAGVVALMRQANPDLSPGEIEYLLKATARKSPCGPAYVRADAAHPWDGSNYASGHGLIDAYAAVEAALTFDGSMPPVPDLEPLPDSFIHVRRGIRIDRTLYFDGDAALSSTAPSGAVPAVRPLGPNVEVTHTTEPITEAITATAFTVDAWIGTTAECQCIRQTAPILRARVDRIGEDGPETIIEDHVSVWFVNPLGPTHRDWVLPLEAPVTIAAGERIAVTVQFADPGVQGLDPVNHWVLYSGAWETPSRMGIGESVIAEPGSAEACAVRQDCVDIGGVRQMEGARSRIRSITRVACACTARATGRSSTVEDGV